MACFLEHTDSYELVESTFAFSSRTKSKDPRQWYVLGSHNKNRSTTTYLLHIIIHT